MGAYENVSLRLTWPVVCALACKALVQRCDFDTICARAIAAYIQQEKDK